MTASRSAVVKEPHLALWRLLVHTGAGVLVGLAAYALVAWLDEPPHQLVAIAFAVLGGVAAFVVSRMRMRAAVQRHLWEKGGDAADFGVLAVLLGLSQPSGGGGLAPSGFWGGSAEVGGGIDAGGGGDGC
jgi:hypothetical protein